MQELELMSEISIWRSRPVNFLAGNWNQIKKCIPRFVLADFVEGEDGRVRAGIVIKNALQLLKAVCILLEPVMPEKMEEMWHQIGMESDVHSVKLDELMVPIESGQALGKPKMLFKRVEA